MYAIQKFLQKMVINQAGPEEATVAGREPLEAKASPASLAVLRLFAAGSCAYPMPSECLQNAFKMHAFRIPTEMHVLRMPPSTCLPAKSGSQTVSDQATHQSPKLAVPVIPWPNIHLCLKARQKPKDSVHSRA